MLQETLLNPWGLAVIGCWVLFAVVWLSNTRGNKKTKGEFHVQWWNVVPAASGILLLFLMWGEFMPQITETLWPRSADVGVTAVLFAIAGLATLFWSRYALGRNWSAQVVLKEGHELVESGPYAYVRHPIYTGIILLSAGTALWLANVGALIAFAVVCISYWGKAQAEEKILREHFGDSYMSYIKRTKALIPYVL